MRYGATPEQWAFFSKTLGATADLLPVVSDPSLAVSGRSSLATRGKVPSLLNAKNEVYGFKLWPSYTATEKDVASWSANTAYGMCVQTRGAFKAIDVDIDNAEVGGRIETLVKQFFPLCATRRRENSQKRLFLFKCPDVYGKKVVKCSVGIIEFLGRGQQFVACGTHTSGVPYTWDAFPETLGVYELEHVENFIVQLALLLQPYQVEVRHKPLTPSRERAEVTGKDAGFVNFLREEHWALSEVGNKIHIKCPFAHEHTGASSPSATTYFREDNNGPGRIKCMHAHCDHRTTDEFKNAMGWVDMELANNFTNLNAELKRGGEPIMFTRDNKGRIECTLKNVYLALSSKEWSNLCIRKDTFTEGIRVRYRENASRPIKDDDYARIRLLLEEQGFKSSSPEIIRSTVHMVAENNQFDSLQDWLAGLKWDGRERVPTFLSSYLGVHDNPYARAVSEYLWTGLAGRALSPGVKADMVVTLTGAQGIRKTTLVEVLAPCREYFVSLDFTKSDADLVRMLRGKVIAEIGELRGMNKREVESVKAFITERVDEWVPKYGEFAIKYPRRSLFIATTNRENFINDSTGSRRWLPVVVTSKANIERVAEDREQLWAEAAVLFTCHGVMYEGAERLADNRAFNQIIPWQRAILQWVAENEGKAAITTEAILVAAVNIPLSRHTPRDYDLVEKVMIPAGYATAYNEVVGTYWRRTSKI